MKSDHWNFLANLLGTPGPAKPREEKAKKQKPAESAPVDTPQPTKAEQEVSSDLAANSGSEEEPKASVDEHDSTFVEENAGSVDAVAEKNTKAKKSEPITREDVLDALTASEPPNILPGFGAVSDDEQPSTLEQLTQSKASTPPPPPQKKPKVEKRKKGNATAFGVGLVEEDASAEATASDQTDLPSDATDTAKDTSVPESKQVPEKQEQEDAPADPWVKLASEIGFESTDSDLQETSSRQTEVNKPSPSQELEDDSRSQPSKRRSARKKTSVVDKASTDSREASDKPSESRNAASMESAGGFGFGLGVEDDKGAQQPEEVLPKNDAFANKADDELDLPGGWASFGDKKSADPEDSEQTTSSASNPTRKVGPDNRDEISARKTDRRRRYRSEDEDGDDRPSRSRSRRGKGKEREEQDESLESASTSRDRAPDRRRPDSDEDTEDSKPRRRRGRRGARQRMSEEDVQGIDEKSALESTHLDDEDQDEVQEKGERRRSGSRRRSRNESSRENPKRGRATREDAEDQEQSEDREVRSRRRDDDEETSGRGRRRGRRGRGGRSRGETDDSRRATSSNESSDSVLKTSAFDDDHEDDHEVEVMRRDQRSSSRGRSRNEDDRAGDGERRGRRRRRPEQSDDGEERTARSSRDQDSEEGRESRGRRTSIPSWLDTVDLLVNANIENHKKPKGGRGRGNKKR